MVKSKEPATVEAATLSMRGSFKLRMTSGGDSVQLSTQPVLIDVSPTIEVLEVMTQANIPKA